MNSHALYLLYPLIAHVWLVVGLYFALGYARKRAVRRGEMQYKEFAPNVPEPLVVARVSRNLSNQFELPVLFYLLVLLTMLSGQATVLDVGLAWVFVASRFAHSVAALSSNRIPPRSATFAIGFVAIMALAGRVTAMILAA